MSVSMPHYLLSSEAYDSADSGRWRFTLRAVDGSEQFETEDSEPRVRGERLGLLTVVRALESLDQPSRVTLVSCSPYVRQGIHYGLVEWRRNGWRWEFFGHMVPVKNRDLWQRLDRAMRFHQVDCRRRRFDLPHERLAGPVWSSWGTARPKDSGGKIRPATPDLIRYSWSAMRAAGSRWLAAVARWWRRRMMRLRMALEASPWAW